MFKLNLKIALRNLFKNKVYAAINIGGLALGLTAFVLLLLLNHETNYDKWAPDLDKVYKKETLWPFFLVRIPGLKQPAIKEIIEKENIDSQNEAALLKRFGKHSISNPYELISN